MILLGPIACIGSSIDSKGWLTAALWSYFEEFYVMLYMMDYDLQKLPSQDTELLCKAVTIQVLFFLHLFYLD